MPTSSPAGAVVKGLLAGAAGTAVMTGSQLAYYKAMDVEPSDTPAQVARKILGLVGVNLPDDKVPAANNAMHWAYGTTWGALYALAAGTSEPRAIRDGLLFGAAVWGASLIHLPAMGLSPPVWELPASAIPPDLGFHLVYGVATGVAYGVVS